MVQDRKVIDSSAAMRNGTVDEIAEAGAFLLGKHEGFITGTDMLIDGGVITAIWTGTYRLHGEMSSPKRSRSWQTT